MKLHTFTPTTNGRCVCGNPRHDWRHGGIPEGKYVPLTDPAVEAAKRQWAKRESPQATVQAMIESTGVMRKKRKRYEAGQQELEEKHQRWEADQARLKHKYWS